MEKIQTLKQKYLSSKSKSWFLAKMFLNKRSCTQKVWNMSEHMRIMNCLKKYEKDDCRTLNNVFEYLASIETLPQGITIYKVVQNANNQIIEEKFKKQNTKKAEVVDFMKYL